MAFDSAMVISQSPNPFFGLITLRTRPMAPLGVGEGSIFFKEGAARQEHVRVIRGLVEEEILHDHAFHGGEAPRHMRRVGIGLKNILALDVNAAESALDGGVEHVRDAQPRLFVERDAPSLLEDRTHGVVRDVPVAGEFMREGAHVARALDVVLAPQRIDAHPAPPKVSRREGEIGDRQHRGRTLAMFGDAEPIIDCRIAAGGIEPRGFSDGVGGNAGDFCDLFRAIAGFRYKLRPILEFLPVATFAHESLVDEPFGDDDMGKRGQDRDIGARLQGKMIVRLHMRHPDKVDPAGIENDQLGALAQSFFHAGSEHRMRIGRVGTDNQDHIRFIDRVEILGSGGRAESGPKAIAGRRMADPRAGIDIVVAETGANELLDEVGLFVGAARRRDAADGVLAVSRLNALELGGGMTDRLVPGNLAPGV
jgi:hypothetical protein